MNRLNNSIILNCLIQNGVDFCRTISVYLCGSMSMDFIVNPRDIDILFIFENDDDKAQFIYKNENVIRYLKKNNRYDIFARTIKEIDFVSMPLFQYSCKYINKLDPIYGRKFLFKEDILTNKNFYIRYLKSYNNMCFSNKEYYLVLILFYALQNNSYILTDKQIDIINKIHDGIYKLSEKDIEKLNKQIDDLTV